MSSTVDSADQSTIDQSSEYEKLIEKTVDDLKSKIEKENFSVAELEKIKKLEKDENNRKTAIEFIDNRIESRVEDISKEDKDTASSSCEEDIEEMEKELEDRLERIEQKLEESEPVDNHSERQSMEIGTLKIQIYEGDPILLLDRGEDLIELKHYHLIDLIRGDISENLTNQNIEKTEPQEPSKLEKNNSKPTNKTSKKPRQEMQEAKDENFNQTPRRDTKDLSKESPSTDKGDTGQQPTEIEKIRKRLKEDYNLEEEDLRGKDLEELEELEDRVADKQELKNEIESKFDVSPGNKSLEELKDLKKELQKVENKRLDILNEYDIDRSRLEGKNLDQLEKIEEELGKEDKLINRLKAYGYTDNDLKDLDVEDLEKKISEIDRKKELLSEIDAEMNDSELKEIKLDELKRLKREKEERKELIESLKKEGLEESNLRSSSTEDLRKLSSEMSSDDSQQEIEETDKTLEEMEEQASDDLELLKGAVPESEAEDESSNKEKNMREKAISKVNKWKSEFSDVRSSSEDEKTEKQIRKEKLLDLLEDYQQIDNNVEKSIKTAQVMKGFLEYSLDIRRELTYKEVAERIQDLGQQEGDEGLLDLAEFFSDIHSQIYSGNVYIENVDQILEISKNIVRDF